MKILINGISSKFGGGKSILINILNEIELNRINQNHNLFFYCLISDNISFPCSYKNIHFIKKNKYVNVLFYYFLLIQCIHKKYKFDYIFNLGDIPIISDCKQIFLFDWAFAVYPKYNNVWNRMGKKEFLVRKLKIFIFNFLKSQISEFFVQTRLIAKKLNQIYSINNEKITLFQNAISFDHFHQFETDKYNLKNIYSNKKIFLCLSAYYSHKNIEILIEVAQLLAQNNSNFLIIVTLPSNKNTNNLLLKIEELNLDRYIVNIGEVNSNYIPNLYKNVDALLLPTLLESFSGTYIEAMFAKIPIFTSNYDFAHEICGESAIYFDPLNEFDIFSKLHLIDNNDLVNYKISQYNKRLEDFPTWHDLYLILINRIYNNQSNNNN
jgi:glycosyltransferase involved in cell wall biosynthesis